MSTVQDIMRELQAGEEAKARVPELTRMVDQLADKLNESHKHAQALELRAKEREETITSLNQRVSSLVVERDDASFRELEAKDHFDTLLESVRPIWSSLGHALNRADPPKPVPVAEPVKAEVKAEAKPDPTASSQAIAGSGSQTAHSTSADLAKAVALSGGTESGQSERPPQPSSANTQADQSASSVSGSTGAVSAEGQSEPGPTVSSQASTDTLQKPSSQPAPTELAGSTGVAGPDPWTPKVEMPEVKAGDAEQYKPFDQPPAKPWEPSF